MNKNVIKAVTLSIAGTFSLSNAQTPFTKYFCELDTQFKNNEILTKQSLKKNAPWYALHNAKSKTSASGSISGIALNRSGNFKYYSGASNIKTFSNGSIYTTHNFDSAGIKSSAIGKSELVFNIGENATISSFSGIPYASDLTPNPISLGKILLGTTNYQTTNNRGNIFAIENFYNTNIDVFNAIKDSFDISSSPSISPSKYPNDNTDFSSIINKLNSAEFTGWILEIDRLNNTFQKRRFDLGRAPRKAVIINSTRTATTPSLANISRTYQILGENDFNILIKTELNNNVQEFYVYSEEENSLSSHWTLINERSSGKIQPLSKTALTNLFLYVVNNANLEFTYFLNVTDIKINETTNTLLIVTPGGNSDINTFKNKYGITGEPILCSYLTPLLVGSTYTDKLGHIIEIDGDDALTFTKMGFKTPTGKFVSNIESITFNNLSYVDEKSDPQNTSFAILSERVFENTMGQNPTHKKNPSEFQNEVYLVNLESLTSSSNTVDIGSKNFELFQILGNNTISLPVSYSETYLPLFSVTKDFNQNVDSLSFIRGFADYFIAPEVCLQNSSIENIATQKYTNGIYPNPLNCQTGNCSLALKQSDAVAIFSIQGQLIQTFEKSESIELENFKTGLYFIKGSTGWSEILVIQ